VGAAAGAARADGRRLVELAALVPEQRPLDLYAVLAEVAR
jgi:hypothetical protein